VLSADQLAINPIPLLDIRVKPIKDKLAELGPVLQDEHAIDDNDLGFGCQGSRI